jgi:DNA-binding transcriptional ArsR family regulator
VNGQNEMSEDNRFEPVPLKTINDLEVLKVAADPLRNQIMELIVPAPTTVGDIARKLGLTPNKLYYHISMLEKHGFIQVVESVVRGNLIEKKYWLTAYDFDIDSELMNFGSPEGRENISTMFLSFADATRDDMRRSIEVRSFNLGQGADPIPRQVVMSRVSVKVSDQKSEEFVKRFNDLVSEFGAEDQPDSDEQIWALSVFMYPSFYYASGVVEDQNSSIKQSNKKTNE